MLAVHVACDEHACSHLRRHQLCVKVVHQGRGSQHGFLVLQELDVRLGHEAGAECVVLVFTKHVTASSGQQAHRRQKSEQLSYRFTRPRQCKLSHILSQLLRVLLTCPLDLASMCDCRSASCACASHVTTDEHCWSHQALRGAKKIRAITGRRKSEYKEER